MSDDLYNPDDRRRWMDHAEVAYEAYVESFPDGEYDDVRTPIVDLILDLLHYGNAHGVSVDRVLWSVRVHMEAEDLSSRDCCYSRRWVMRIRDDVVRIGMWVLTNIDRTHKELDMHEIDMVIDWLGGSSVPEALESLSDYMEGDGGPA